MTHPGTLASLAPPTEATTVRRIEQVERTQRETLPAVMEAVAPMFAEIRAAQAALAEAQQALEAQQVELQAQVARINDLVNKQIAVTSGAKSDEGFAYGTDLNAQYAVMTVPIPAGFTKATLYATGSARCSNTTTGPQYMFLQTFGGIVGSSSQQVWGGTQQVTLAAGYQGTVSAGLARDLVAPSASGHTLRVWVQAWTSAPTSAVPGNYAGVDFVVTFSR